MPQFQNKGGFTLVELLITVSVIALSLAVVAPSISDWGPSFRLKTDVQEVRTLLQMARTEAVKRTQPISVRFLSGEPEGLVVFQDSDGDGSAGAGETIANYSLSADTDYGRDAGVATLAGTDFAGTLVIFQSDGSLRDTAGAFLSGEVYLNLDASSVDLAPSLFKTYAVTVTMSGAVDARKWRAGAWD